METGVDEIGRNGQLENNADPSDDEQQLNGSSTANEDEGDALGSTSFPHGDTYARMPVPKYASHYKMDHPEKSIAYIFNHENFEVGGLKKRSGTNKDSSDLKEVLDKLNFDVHEFKDLKLSEVMGHIQILANTDHSKRNCVVVCVLSHGEMGSIYTKDSYYKPENLWTHFTGDKCPTLAGKPKMFFIQACQGDRLDNGVTMMRQTETDGENHHSYKLPVQADFLMVFSTVSGYYSWRNTTHGSWFVQALCAELARRHQTDDLLTILTYVAQRVAVDFESNTPDIPAMHRRKQIPCVVSMLTRIIHFRAQVEAASAQGGAATAAPQLRSDTEGNIVPAETEPKNKFAAFFSNRGSLSKN